MKKSLFILFLILFAFSASAHMENSTSGFSNEHSMCWFCFDDIDIHAVDTVNGSEIMITSEDKNTAVELQERSDEWVDWHNETNKDGRFEGMMMHSMYGAEGSMCPFCDKNITISSININNGVKLTVLSKNIKDVNKLQKDIKNWVKWHLNMVDTGMMGRGMMMHDMQGSGTMMNSMSGNKYNRRNVNMMNSDWGYHSGLMGGGILMWLLILVVLAVVTVLLIKAFSHLGHHESALDILKKRYSKGEISKVEYEKIKKDL